jgi:hypothetical protein
LIYPAVDNTTPYTYYETPTLFLPAAGGRNYSTGSLFNGGSYGNYWSSTAYSSENNANDYNLYFNSGNGGSTYALPQTNMGISEKIVHSTPSEINIYLEGVFWVALFL